MPKQVASVPREGGGEAGPGLQAGLASTDLPPPFALGLNSWKPGLGTRLFEGGYFLSYNRPVCLASGFWALSFSEGTDRMSSEPYVCGV